LEDAPLSRDSCCGVCAGGGLAVCAIATAVNPNQQTARSLLAPIGTRRSVCIVRAIVIQQPRQILARI
jgi:hypothetical protein